MMKTYQKYNGKSLRSWIAQTSLDLRIRQQTLILAKKSPQKTADSKQDPEPMEAQEQETTTNRQFRN